MRSSSICATTVALVAFVGACSDGSGLTPPSGGSGTTTTGGQPGTAGTTVIPLGGTGVSTGGTGVSTGGTGITPGGGSTGTNAGTGGSGGTGTATGGTAAGGAATGGSGGGASDPYSGPFKILVLSTALQFAHDSIPICALMVGIEGAFQFSGLKLSGTNLRQEVEVTENRGTQLPNLGVTPDAMMPQGTKPGSQWTADLAKDDLSDFTDDNLKKYAMVFSCSPTGTVFSNNPFAKDPATEATAMAALQKFVENGGAFGGVHSASDFENSNGYPWFTNTLMGGYFVTHDGDGTPGTVQVVSMYANHPVMRGVPATWSTQDEWYHMNRDIGTQPGFQILATLASDNRPVVWVKNVSKGRMFYTIRGHNRDRFDKEPPFRQTVLNGILWATQRLN